MDEKITSLFSSEEMTKVMYKFIRTRGINQSMCIINEILMMHPVLVFNPDTYMLTPVEAVGENGGAILLKLKSEDKSYKDQKEEFEKEIADKIIKLLHELKNYNEGQENG